MKKLLCLFYFLLIPTISFAGIDKISSSIIQCWGCPIFDRLFILISKATARVYSQFTNIALFILTIGLGIYLVYIVIKTFGKVKDSSTYYKAFIPTFLTALTVTIFLQAGLSTPQLVSNILFEPVAQITKVYSDTLIQTSKNNTDIKVTYNPLPMDNTINNFYSENLKNSTLDLMKNNTVFFQNFILLGIATIGHSISIKTLFGPTEFGNSILALLLGIAILYIFVTLFFKFCFYFIDLIVDLTIFAFFFPFILIGWVFQFSDVPDEYKSLGKTGTTMVRNIIQSITTFIVVVVVYIIAFNIIVFFLGDNTNNNHELLNSIITGNYHDIESNISLIVFEGTLFSKTISIIFLGYFIKVLMIEIPKITKSLLSEFGVGTTRVSAAETVYQSVKQFTQALITQTKKFIEKKESKK